MWLAHSWNETPYLPYISDNGEFTINSIICSSNEFTNPLIVDARNTRYGPSMFLTYGRGMAAASSMTRSSAWPSLCASVGWMYWKKVGTVNYILIWSQEKYNEIKKTGLKELSNQLHILMWSYQFR